MKKNLLFSAASAALVLVSCHQEQAEIPVKENGHPVEITVSIQGTPATRATHTDYADESKVNTLQVFVFNGEDCEAHKSVTGSLQALVPATSGERTIWAVVNGVEDLYEDGLTLTGLKTKVTALSDNTKENFVMTGSTKQELVDGENVPIAVKRIVSRVSVAKISCNLKDYRKDYSIRIEKIYMINVAGDSPYEAGGEASSWVNKLGHTDAAYDVLLYDELSGVTIRNSILNDAGKVITDNSYGSEHAFYPYPNVHGTNVEGEAQAYAAEWTPRGSMVVIEVTMFQGDSDTEGIHGYYPVALPALERNKNYIIEEVQISRLPGDNPYEPIDTGETKVTISVHEWETGLNLGTIEL